MGKVIDITVEGKQINLGRYDSLEEAVTARRKGEIKYYGFTLDRGVTYEEA